MTGYELGEPFAVPQDRSNVHGVRLFGAKVAGRPVLVRVTNDPGHEVHLIDALDGTPAAGFTVVPRRWLGVCKTSWYSTFLTSHVYQAAGGPRLVTTHDEWLVRQWNLATRRQATRARRLPESDWGWIKAITSYADAGRTVLLLGGHDALVRRYDAATGREIAEPLRHDVSVDALAVYAVDGVRHIASGDASGRLHRWDAATGRKVGRQIAAHQGPIRWIVAYLVEGRPQLVTGSIDQTVRRWDALTGDEIGETRYFGEVPLAALLTGEGADRLLVVGCDDKLHRYRAATGEPVGEPIDCGADFYVVDLCELEVAGRRALFVCGDPAAIRRFDARTFRPWPVGH
ncbi:WD40 repeat domain-containing protein [Catellatospora sichuanensis]|uniref:WD40 repeat domain-containing protein n=1 Tax=Catellatospora sichuanensis TaxID=1969805 RepID=UPI0011839AC1|nr:WD40 repeat domain-containing protein [Catellatospora sichuanensis]